MPDWLGPGTFFFFFVVGFRDGVVVGVAGQGLSAGREGVANVLMLGAIYGFMAI